MIESMKNAANDLTATINATAGQLDAIGQQDMQTALDNLTRASADLQDRFARAASELAATLTATLAGIQQTMAGLAASLAVPVAPAPVVVPEAANDPFAHPAPSEHRRRIAEVQEHTTEEPADKCEEDSLHAEVMGIAAILMSDEGEVAAVAANSPVQSDPPTPAQLRLDTLKKPKKRGKSA